MKLGLKETLTVVALATAGCTSPDLEDNKNETHPVSAVPGVNSNVITEETVKAVRTACATANVQEQNKFISELPYGIRGDVGYGYFKLAEHAGKRVEKECLALHGLSDDNVVEGLSF